MKIPILILLFNRPKFTRRLISKLKEIKPTTIYINIDGPRKNNSKDKIFQSEITEIIKQINWTLDIKINFSKVNKGCRKSVREAIDWVLSIENHVIILEDDCIPSNIFFKFCDKMLDKYKNNNRVKAITGNNFQKKKIGESDYYFSKYAHCWGWATWRRSWKNYDDKMYFWNDFKSSKEWNLLHNNKLEEKYWRKKFDLTYNRKIDSWAYVWLASIWFNNGLTITPNQNLVKNIGFDINSTHTFGLDTKKYSMDAQEGYIDFNNHPKNITANTDADLFTFNNHYNGKYNFFPWRIIYLLKILIKNPKIFFLKIIKKIK